MNLEEKITTRLQELIVEGNRVLQTKSQETGERTRLLAGYAVNYEMASQWATSCLSILGRVFGKDSDHYTRFKELGDEFETHEEVRKAFGVLKAAKDDYEKGGLFDTKALIQAEVFDDFLEQAEHLLSKTYYQPAAVLAGAVLEDGLRRLCERRDISLPPRATIDPMNVALAKDGAYSSLMQKKLTFLADLRNKAAHGKFSDVGENDVRDMLTQVRSFMETHFS
jgi:hypothetical protein